ncbi:polysaccharide biosynthesis protein [Clostridium niameyense]|uniref:Polysaccharide biosynthesis protein n=1 Tax=Clostridium niameyense TaxID=1622073 RepID=A0A6M0R9Q1_9CLOT|nr:polysaccharide biosynthesis protein [Clostridium niameyense]NEZ46390.1 polysaccharide biosynthesis protein [Clostridium niameyense]
MEEQSVTKGFAILSIAGILGKILSLLYIPILRYILKDEGYGIYTAAYQIYAFMFVLTNAGIPVAISKLISELTATDRHKDAIRAFKLARIMLLLLGSIMAFFMIILARPLANITQYSRAYIAVVALAPSILFTSVASAYRGYFQGRANMIPTAVSQVIEQILNTIFSLVCAALLIKYGLELGCAGGTIGTSIGALFSALFLLNYYNRNKKIKYNKIKERKYSNRQLIRKIIQYGLPITLCVGMNYAGNIVDLYNTKSRLMVGGFTNSQATILYGFLGKYQQLINVPIAIITSLSAAILPAISGAVVNGDKKAVKSNINYAFRLCFLIAIPSAVGLRVLSRPVYEMLKLGRGYDIMGYGALVLVFMAIAQIQTTILQSIGKLNIATIYSLIGIICKIAVNYFLIAIPSINIKGAIYGSIVGFLVPIILNHRIIKKTLRVKFNLLKPMVKPLISAEIMGVVVFAVFKGIHMLLSLVNKGYITNFLATVVAILAGILFYGFALALTGGLNKEDLNKLPNKFVRLIPNFIKRRLK